MRTMQEAVKSTKVMHVSESLTEFQIKHQSEDAKLHGMHMPYQRDFGVNKKKIAKRKVAFAQNPESITKED